MKSKQNSTTEKKPERNTGSFRQNNPSVSSKNKNKKNVDSEADNGNEASGWLNSEYSPERGKDKNGNE